MIVYANLDQEARWGRATLPQAVQRRISAASTLMAAFAPDGEPVTIYAPVAVDRERVRFAHVELCTGVPERWDLAWADPAAQHANDRRTALALAHELGVALPGARVLDSLAELDTHLAAGAATAGVDGRWVCKAPWTAAGRDRAHGAGDVVGGELRVHVGRMLERFGAVTFEPWCDRTLDLGVCAQLGADGSLHAERPHTLRSDPRGGFLGIDLIEPALTETEHGELARVVAAAAERLHALGYAGPFTVDAFVYRERGERKLHPLCELNARHTFGHVARALRARLGTHVLGFGSPPADARVLVAPGDEGVAAWAI